MKIIITESKVGQIKTLVQEILDDEFLARFFFAGVFLAVLAAAEFGGFLGDVFFGIPLDDIEVAAARFMFVGDIGFDHRNLLDQDHVPGQ